MTSLTALLATEPNETLPVDELVSRIGIRQDGFLNQAVFLKHEGVDALLLHSDYNNDNFAHENVLLYKSGQLDVIKNGTPVVLGMRFDIDHRLLARFYVTSYRSPTPLSEKIKNA